MKAIFRSFGSLLFWTNCVVISGVAMRLPIKRYTTLDDFTLIFRYCTLILVLLLGQVHRVQMLRWRLTVHSLQCGFRTHAKLEHGLETRSSIYYMFYNTRARSPIRY